MKQGDGDNPSPLFPSQRPRHRPTSRGTFSLGQSAASPWKDLAIPAHPGPDITQETTSHFPRLLLAPLDFLSSLQGLIQATWSGSATLERKWKVVFPELLASPALHWAHRQERLAGGEDSDQQCVHVRVCVYFVRVCLYWVLLKYSTKYDRYVETD